jgi:hypothetical protein
MRYSYGTQAVASAFAWEINIGGFLLKEKLIVLISMMKFFSY